MTRKMLVLMAVAGLLLVAALPAAAQEVPVPYDEVAPIVVERPVPPPRVPADQPPGAIDVPAQPPGAVDVPAAPGQPAAVGAPGAPGAPGDLATTGLQLNVGLALAVALILTGIGALVLAARRDRRVIA